MLHFYALLSLGEPVGARFKRVGCFQKQLDIMGVLGFADMAAQHCCQAQQLPKLLDFWVFWHLAMPYF
jgi:hypothetical protein